MEEVITKIERCEVTCEYCNNDDYVIAYEDEIPTICNNCGAPSLRVINRWDTGYSDHVSWLN